MVCRSSCQTKVWRRITLCDINAQVCREREVHQRSLLIFFWCFFGKIKTLISSLDSLMSACRGWPLRWKDSTTPRSICRETANQGFLCAPCRSLQMLLNAIRSPDEDPASHSPTVCRSLFCPTCKYQEIKLPWCPRALQSVCKPTVSWPPSCTVCGCPLMPLP